MATACGIRGVMLYFFLYGFVMYKNECVTFKMLMHCFSSASDFCSFLTNPSLDVPFG